MYFISFSSSFSFEVDEIDPYVYSHGSPPWLPTTFDLTYELTQFAIYFQVNLFLFNRIFIKMTTM